MLDWRSRRRSRHAGRWVATAPILALIALLVLVGAGCGGSSDTKANEAYANSVCSAVGNWEQEIKSIATSFTGGVSQGSFQTSITQAEAATKTLLTQIKAVPPPDSSEGQAAKQQLDQLTTDISNALLFNSDRLGRKSNNGLCLEHRDRLRRRHSGQRFLNNDSHSGFLRNRRPQRFHRIHHSLPQRRFWSGDGFRGGGNGFLFRNNGCGNGGFFNRWRDGLLYRGRSLDRNRGEGFWRFR